MVFLTEMHNLNLIMRQNQTNPNLGEFNKITGQYSSKPPMSLREKKMRKFSKVKGSKDTQHLNTMYDARSDPGLEKGKQWNIKTNRNEGCKLGNSIVIMFLFF